MTSPQWTRRELYQATVSLPIWLEDEPGCQFKNATNDDELVAIERLPPGHESVEAVARRKLNSLQKVYAPVTVTTPESCQRAHWPARGFTVTSALLPRVTLSLAAIDTPGGITLLQSIDAPGRMETFDVAVTTLSAKAAVAPSKAGFHHVPCLRLFLDLPTRLVPPKDFLFAGRGAQVRIRFEKYGPAISAPDLPYELHLPDGGPWRLINTPQRADRQSPTAGAISSERWSVLSTPQLQQLRYCYCEATASRASEGRTARLTGTAGEQAQAELSSEWDAIVDSLNWKRAGHGG